MIINLSPQRRDDSLSLFKVGDIIIINNEPFDFTRIQEGDTLPREAIKSEWFSTDVTRENGHIAMTLLFPNPWNYSEEQAFPKPIVKTEDGIVDLPKPRDEEQLYEVELNA